MGFSEPGAGSDLASLTTTAVRDGDNWIINGHKIWTSYSDIADWCLVLARTDPEARRHKGISAFICSMHQPGIEQRPLKMISGITQEFGQVSFDNAVVPAENIVRAPGDGEKPLAMTVVGHEREPSTPGFRGPVRKLVRQMAKRVEDRRPKIWPGRPSVEMLTHHVRRRLSEQLDRITHGPTGRSTSC